MKLDLGCGDNKREGAIGIDWRRDSSADIIADLNKGIPLADDSVDEVYASHVLEHLDDLDGMMREIHRVCKAGARVHVAVPSFWSSLAVNPHHRHFFVRHSFDGFDGREDFPRLFRVTRKPPLFADIPLLRELHVFRELRFELEIVNKEVRK